VLITACRWAMPTHRRTGEGGAGKIEQLNMVGKRSGEGIVTHRATMVNVLSRGLADRLMLMDFTIGRKGLLNYIRSLAGSNIVKIVPSSNGNASDDADCPRQRLKIVCGSYQSYLDDMAWCDDKTAYTAAEVRFTSANTITPNIGNVELAEAIARVLPFTATEDARPVLQNVLFEASEGKLKLVAADGFTLAEAVLDLDIGSDEAVRVLIDRTSLRPIPSALRKAKRVRVSFGKAGDTLDGMMMYVDTEVSRYKFMSSTGQYPDYAKVIPTEFSCRAHLDTQETLKAVLALKATSEDAKGYAVDLTIGGGKMIMANPDERGEAVINADSGEDCGIVRLNGKYLADALKALGGMTDLNLNRAYDPVMLTADGLRVLIMPIASPKANEQQRADRGEVETESTADADVEIAEEADAEVTAEVDIEAIEAAAEIDAELEAVEAGEEQPEPPKRRARGRKAVAVA